MVCLYITCLQINGLVQERCHSSALAMELRLSCTNPSRYDIISEWKVSYPSISECNFMPYSVEWSYFMV